MFLFDVCTKLFQKRGHIQGGILFKGGHYLRKYGILQNCTILEIAVPGSAPGHLMASTPAIRSTPKTTAAQRFVHLMLSRKKKSRISNSQKLYCLIFFPGFELVMLPTAHQLSVQRKNWTLNFTILLMQVNKYTYQAIG